MENQHRRLEMMNHIKLRAERDLMDKIKAHSMAIEVLLSEVHAHVGQQIVDAQNMAAPDEAHRIDAAQPRRWLAIARTDFQTGFMALTRAVAQPTSF